MNDPDGPEPELPRDPENMHDEAESRGDTSLYAELRQLAHRLMNRERADCSLDATELVHEFYLKLRRQANSTSLTPEEIRRFSARMMRQVLIDRARRRATRRDATKGKRVPLELLTTGVQNEQDLLDVDDAINRLAKCSEVMAELVRLRFYGGLSIEAASESLRISRATAFRYWDFAKAWLIADLRGERKGPADSRTHLPDSEVDREQGHAP